MENDFVKITNKAFAVIFTVMFFTTLCGIISEQAWWHIYTLIVTAILAIAFWSEKDDDTSDEPKYEQP